MEVHIHIDDKLVDAVKTLTRSFTRRRVAAIASLSVVATSFVADAAPVGNLIEFQDGGEIDAKQFNDNFGKLRTAIDALFIREDRTISVANCAELIAQLNALDESRILAGASVTLEIAPGIHRCPSSVDIGHVDGHRMSIVGAGDAPGDVTLTFEGSGIGVQHSHALLLLSNLTVQGDGTGVGVYVTRGSSLMAQRIVANEFEDGFRVNYGSTLSLTETESTSNTGSGYLARGGSMMALDDVNADDNAIGIATYENSTVVLRGVISVSSSSEVGVAATRGGLVSGDGNLEFSDAEPNAVETQEDTGGMLID